MNDDTNSTDHCRHGDHAVCDRWFRDVCGCGCHPRSDKEQQR